MHLNRVDFCTEGDSDAAEFSSLLSNTPFKVFAMPSMPEQFTPIVYLIILQLYTYRFLPPSLTSPHSSCLSRCTFTRLECEILARLGVRDEPGHIPS